MTKFKLALTIILHTKIKVSAAIHKISMNDFIIKAIEEKLIRDGD